MSVRSLGSSVDCRSSAGRHHSELLENGGASSTDVPLARARPDRSCVPAEERTSAPIIRFALASPAVGTARQGAGWEKLRARRPCALGVAAYPFSPRPNAGRLPYRVQAGDNPTGDEMLGPLVGTGLLAAACLVAALVTGQGEFIAVGLPLATLCIPGWILYAREERRRH